VTDYVTSSNAFFEVDPLKLRVADKLEVNQQNLVNFLEFVLSLVSDSLREIPAEVLKAFKIMKATIEAKFGSEVADRINGFIFSSIMMTLSMSFEHNSHISYSPLLLLLLYLQSLFIYF
jgi:hypothetical protein